MKKFLSLIAVVMLALGLCASCEGKEDLGNPIGGGDGSGLVDGQWYEDGNVLRYQVTYNVGYGYDYTMLWELTFEGDSCVKSICTYTFSDATMADVFYEEMKDMEEEGCPVTKSGKKVTVDMTSIHRGLSKEEVKLAIGMM